MRTASFSPVTSAEFTRKPCGDAVTTSTESFDSARADAPKAMSPASESVIESRFMREILSVWLSDNVRTAGIRCRETRAVTRELVPENGCWIAWLRREAQA